MKKLFKKDGLVEKGQDLLKNEDPIQSKMSAEKLRLQISQDAKKLNKSDFAKKYSSLSESDKKMLNVSKEDNVQDIYKTANDFWDEKAIQNKITGYQGLYEKQQTEKVTLQKAQEAEKAKQQELYNTSKGYIDQYNSLKGSIQNKYKYNPDEKMADPMQAYREGVIKEAEERIKNKKDVKVPGNPNDENTCISGTCTLAANQGVDFSKLIGKGLAIKDKEGRPIPVQNKAFYDNLDKTGYTEVQKDQIQPGDFVQYDDVKTGNPLHMEMFLGKEKLDNGKEYNKLFNNYSLSNYNDEEDAGQSYREFKQDNTVYNPEGEKSFSNMRVLRIKPETAEAAYIKLHPEYATQLQGKKSFESSEDYKNYTDLSNKVENLKKTNPDLYAKITSDQTTAKK
jgi:hypothetical protein